MVCAQSLERNPRILFDEIKECVGAALQTYVDDDDLRVIFDKYDKDNSGELDLREFVDMYSEYFFS